MSRSNQTNARRSYIVIDAKRETAFPVTVKSNFRFAVIPGWVKFILYCGIFFFFGVKEHPETDLIVRAFTSVFQGFVIYFILFMAKEGLKGFKEDMKEMFNELKKAN